MLTRDDVLSLGYLKKATFHGSYRGMRFQMQKSSREEETFLLVYAWPEPFTLPSLPMNLNCLRNFHLPTMV